MSDAYASAGVDIDAGHEAVSRYRTFTRGARHPRVLEGLGGFAGCFDLCDWRDPVLVASTDGVGTKVLVAAALGRFATIGRDLVHHCINDIACLNARPLFFLDYLAVGRLDPAMAETVVRGIADGCAEFDVALLGGETAEMPGVYEPAHFDLAGTIVGAVEREAMLDVTQVELGDAIVGLPANGLHTNGYSLARRVFEASRWQAHVDGLAITIADALLAVHPCYLPYVRAVESAGIPIKAMAHITGGGLVDNMPRVLPEHLAARFYAQRWRVPPILAQLAREASLSHEEAYRTLNMGIGFCMVVAARHAAAALEAVNDRLRETPIPMAESEPASLAGEIEPRHPCAPAVVIS